METKSSYKSYGGVQGVYTHDSAACTCPMTFAAFIPPHKEGDRLPVLWFLSGLTCTHANVMEKGEYRRAAAELGVVIICPDTSPRGEGIPTIEGNWKMGLGASFYVDATEAPWSSHYKMWTYIITELPELVARNFPVDMKRQGIFGHSMGGHGALISALRNPQRFKSCSAFAPIVHPMAAAWSEPALTAYLGEDQGKQRAYDAVALIEDGAGFSELLVDQGTADQFLKEGWLLPEQLVAACQKAAIPLKLRMQEGYDHSYYFISTFMSDHIAWHAERLRK